ncbi:fibronectin type III domain-containing protein [Paenibacillus sp. PL2-23]|uniref:fibronectin type III domain-containing protein n=1 Tax=Paenibacillus sp. PL2-23 TaxID=2100729 RepID=UPI0030FAC6BC
MLMKRGRALSWRALPLWLACMMLISSVYPAAAYASGGEAGPAAAEPYVVTAAAEKTEVKTGEQASLTVKVAARVDREAAVALQVIGPAGNIVAKQLYPKAMLSSGSEMSYSFAWNVPHAVPTGEYVVSVQVTDAERKTIYANNERAVVLNVQSPIEPPKPNKRADYTAAAVTGRTMLKAGETMAGTAMVQSSHDTTVQVKVELFHASGAKLYSHTYENQAMQAKQRYLFPMEWKVPKDAKPGLHQAIVSISKPGGGELYKRNLLSGFFIVTKNGNTNIGDTTPPSVPGGLQAEVAGDGFIKLRWTPVKNVDTAGYKVYVNGAEAGWSREVQAGQEPEYTIAGLANGRAYTFSVSALDLAGNESARSKSISAAPIDRIAPSAPQGLTAQAGDGTITLSWQANTERDLAGYRLYSSTDQGKSWDAGILLGVETSYTAHGLTNGSTYTYALAALDTSDNASPKSAPASATPVDRTPPGAPAEIGAEAGDGEVIVRWSAVGAADLHGYILYVSEDGGTTWRPGIEAGNVLAYTVTGLANNTVYTFAVAAKDQVGNESGKSVYTTATPVDGAAPSAPAGLTAEAGDGEVKLRWSPVPPEEGAEGYLVYVSEDGGAVWLAPLPAGNAAEYVVGGLTNGVAYTFAVAAFDGQGNESDKSAPVEATPKGSHTGDLTPPAAPVIMMGIPESNGAVIVWTAGTEEDLAKYRIYKSADGGATWDSGVDVGLVTMHFYQGLQGGLPYTFALTAIDTSGNESEKSEPVTVTPIVGPDRTPPAVPTGVSAAPGSKVIGVSWSPVPDADLQNYYVYVTHIATGSFQRIYAGTDTFYRVTNLTNGVEYAIEVTAVDQMNNESARSAAVHATPISEDQTPPSVPAHVRITDVRDGMLSLA